MIILVLIILALGCFILSLIFELQETKEEKERYRIKYNKLHEKARDLLK